jgi:hypothetical protein
LAPEERELLTKVHKRQATTSVSTDSTAPQQIKVYMQIERWRILSYVWK